jgi:NAD(P)-dependent dehydrogenase (short-subunit alcohol dehydrogenase family)
MLGEENMTVKTERPSQLRVLITAGASGIGRVIAESFAQTGARLHICDIADAALDEAKKNHPTWGVSRCDVSQSDQVAGLFEEVGNNFGGLDVLINNAGIAGPTGGVEEITADDWRRTVDIKLNSQFYCVNRAVPLLKKSQNASIICISSVAGRLGYAYRTPYAATKWAIIGLSKSLAIELGPSGIRVNALLPGIVEGPRIETVISERARALGVSYGDMKQEYINKVSLRRMVTAQDVANQAMFLCSSAGMNISGQSISICGNVEVL